MRLEENENRLNLLIMSNKTITIQQGTGDDALEMTVQVTQEELDKMEEIRSKDPSVWEGRGLDLVKAAKEAIINAFEENAQPQKSTNWKLILGIALGVLTIIGTIIFAEKSRNKEQEVSQKQEINNAGAIEQWIGSECVEVNRRRIYEALKENNNSAVPESFNVFSKAMDNQSYRDWAYEEALQQKLKIGTKEAFELAMTQPNSDIFRCIFEIASYFGMPDSEEDMVSYLKESEENRKKFYNKLLEVGMPNGFDEFEALLNYSQNNRQQFNEDNMRKIYDKLATLGSKGSYEQFLDYFNANDDNKRAVYDKLAANGSKGSYEQFIEYAGYKTNNAVSQNLIDLYEHLCEKKQFNGSVEDFKNSLMNDSYRYALYQYLSEKAVFNGSYSLFSEELDLSTNFIPIKNDHKRVLYDILTLNNYDLGDYETFSQKMNNEKKRRTFYDAVSEEYDIGSWEEFSDKVVDSPKNSDFSLVSSQLTTFSSKQYNFTYQYDNDEFKLVEKTNKSSHCVMKLQSPVDEVKSTLVSVWENPEFSSSYDTDFIFSCQSVDEEMGKVISSAVKTKVDGVNALKSELIISPIGKSYYAAIYRIIHKKRMYMLNIYIPMEEYNKDKSYGDKCANNFKFN